MTRNEQLDRMTEEDKQEDLLRTLAGCDFLRFDRREQLAFWGAAIDALEKSGKVTVKFIDNEIEQYSCYEVRKHEA